MRKRILITTIALSLLATPPVAEAQATPPMTEAKVNPSCPQYEAQLRKHGLPVKQFSYIMWRESRCIPKAIGWNYKQGKGHKDCVLSPAETYRHCEAISSYDVGLVQVNSTWKTLVAQICKRPRRQLIKSLSKPSCNLKVARYLYKNGGLEHWRITSGKN
jgi:hypothetical protein